MTKQQPRGLKFKDKKGHELAQVCFRSTSQTGPQKIDGYFYCPKCKKFFKSEIKQVDVEL